MQDVRKAIAGRADDSIAGIDVLINTVLGVEHSLDFSNRDSDGHPITSVRAGEGGNVVDIVVS